MSEIDGVAKEALRFNQALYTMALACSKSARNSYDVRPTPEARTRLVRSLVALYKAEARVAVLKEIK